MPPNAANCTRIDPPPLLGQCIRYPVRQAKPVWASLISTTASGDKGPTTFRGWRVLRKIVDLLKTHEYLRTCNLDHMILTSREVLRKSESYFNCMADRQGVTCHQKARFRCRQVNRTSQARPICRIGTVIHDSSYVHPDYSVVSDVQRATSAPFPAYKIHDVKCRCHVSHPPLEDLISLGYRVKFPTRTTPVSAAGLAPRAHHMAWLLDIVDASPNACPAPHLPAPRPIAPVGSILYPTATPHPKEPLVPDQPSTCGARLGGILGGLVNVCGPALALGPGYSLLWLIGIV